VTLNDFSQITRQWRAEGEKTGRQPQTSETGGHPKSEKKIRFI